MYQIPLHLAVKKGDVSVDKNEVRRIFSMISKNHRDEYRQKTFVNIDNSPAIFKTPEGVATYVINTCQSGGFPYIIGSQIQREFRNRALKAAADTGWSHALVSKNNTGWTSMCINRVIHINKVNVNKVAKATASAST